MQDAETTLRHTKFYHGRSLKLQFGVTQFKEFLVLQLARVRIQTELLLSCLVCYFIIIISKASHYVALCQKLLTRQ
jgi:hypothetical protein